MPRVDPRKPLAPCGRCGAEAYRPASHTGRRQAARCDGCHLITARCRCALVSSAA